MNERVTHAIFAAIDEVNQQLPREKQLEKSLDTVLFGEEGKLDSLGLVNLIVATEEKIEEEFNAQITLAGDEEIFSDDDSPLATIGTFIDYVSLILGRKSNEKSRI